MYTLNNPVRYIDPSGLLTDDQINDWVVIEGNDDIETLDDLKSNYPELYELLVAMSLGDDLYGVNGGSVQGYGHVHLENGRLRIGKYTAYGLAQRMGDSSELALIRFFEGVGGAVTYRTGDYDWGLPDAMRTSEGEDIVTPGAAFAYQMGRIAVIEAISTVATAAIGKAVFGDPGALVGAVLGFWVGIGVNGVDLALTYCPGSDRGRREGDRIVTTSYALPGRSTDVVETIIIRGDQIIEHTVTLYDYSR
jgi:hypothetical protein